MATKVTETKKPELPATITVTVDDQSRDIFMSFGLLNELTSVIDDPQRIASIPLNNDVRNQVLSMVLADRKKSGKLIAEIDLSETDISISDVEILIDWVQGHLLDFFVRSLKRVMALTKNHEAEVASLASSLDGFKGLISSGPSSGPSESPPAD